MPIVFYAYDLLHLDGVDLQGEALVSRKEKLAKVVEGAGVMLSASLQGSPGTIVAKITELGLEGVAGIAVLVAIVSAIKKTAVAPGLMILGDLSIQGNIKAVPSLVEPLQVAMENGARRALIPLENKRNFLEVSGDIVEKVDPVFFSDPQSAAMKALGLN